MAKRGLIVTYYFPPTGGGGVQRWVKYIKYLSRLGWQFTVITSPHETRNPRDDTLLREIPQETEIIYTPSRTVKPAGSIFKFLRNSGYWQRWLSAFIHITDSRKKWNRQAKKIIIDQISKTEYDAVIFSIPPYSIAFLAAEFSGKLNCPVYLDFRDPWTRNPYKIYPTVIHRYWDSFREKHTVLKVDRIISAYDSLIKDFENRISGFTGKPNLFLPNGFDEADFNEIDNTPFMPGEGIQIGFSGSVYSHLNTPQILFKAIQVLKKKNVNVHFNHIGTSVYDLKKWAEKYGVGEQVHLWGYRPHKECLSMLNRMDILCLILDDRRAYAENTIGGKFYEYLRLKRPILALVPPKGDAAEVIRKTNSGAVVSRQDAREIARVILELASAKHSCTWDGIDLYRRENQARKLQLFLES